MLAPSPGGHGNALARNPGIDPANVLISIVENDAKLYDQTVVITYHYMTQTKTGDKYTEGVGKVTRVWARVADGWKMVHEHTSSG